MKSAMRNLTEARLGTAILCSIRHHNNYTATGSFANSQTSQKCSGNQIYKVGGMFQKIYPWDFGIRNTVLYILTDSRWMWKNAGFMERYNCVKNIWAAHFIVVIYLHGLRVYR